MSLEGCRHAFFMETGRLRRELHPRSGAALACDFSQLQVFADSFRVAAQFEEFEKRMGYRLILRRLEYPKEVIPGSMMPVQMWWYNAGVAPVYGKYSLAVQLKSESGQAMIHVPADVTTWLPGDSVVDDSLYVPRELPSGNYHVRIALLDPRTGQPAIRLAIEGRQETAGTTSVQLMFIPSACAAKYTGGREWVRSSPRQCFRLAVFAAVCAVAAGNSPGVAATQTDSDGGSKVQRAQPIIESEFADHDFQPDGNLDKPVWTNVRRVRFDEACIYPRAISAGRDGGREPLDCALPLSRVLVPLPDAERFRGRGPHAGALGIMRKDVVEAFIAPDASRSSHYYEFEIAPTNQWVDLEIDLTRQPFNDVHWNSGFEHATYIDAARHISDRGAAHPRCRAHPGGYSSRRGVADQFLPLGTAPEPTAKGAP